MPPSPPPCFTKQNTEEIRYKFSMKIKTFACLPVCPLSPVFSPSHVEIVKRIMFTASLIIYWAILQHPLPLLSPRISLNASQLLLPWPLHPPKSNKNGLLHGKIVMMFKTTPLFQKLLVFQNDGGGGDWSAVEHTSIYVTQ